MHDLIEQFQSEMRRYDLHPADGMTICADGQLQRYRVVGDKSNTKNGWYVLHLDGIPSGAFGSWKMNFSSTWCAKSRSLMRPEEISEHRRRIDKVCRQREQVKKQEQYRAAKRAHEIWRTSKSADPLHPYLQMKRITPFVARQRGNALVLPVIDCGMQIHSLQFINQDGSKLLLSGGAKKGHFIPITPLSPNSIILLAEGYATSATLAQNYPDKSVIAAIDAGNLESVAIAIRRSFPNKEIIICADDDRRISGNPGITKGRQAAITVGAKFAAPQWPEGAPDSLTDFNDLARWLANKEVA